MLRTEIRRLYQDKGELKQLRSDNLQAISVQERKVELYKEMADKLKAERYELQRSNYFLKRKCDEAERKYYDSKIIMRRLVEKQQQERASTILNSTSVGNLTSLKSPSDTLNGYTTNMVLDESSDQVVKIGQTQDGKQIVCNRRTVKVNVSF